MYIVPNKKIEIAEGLILNNGIFFENNIDLEGYMMASPARKEICSRLNVKSNIDVSIASFTNLNDMQYYYCIYDINKLFRDNPEYDDYKELLKYIISRNFSLEEKDVHIG